MQPAAVMFGHLNQRSLSNLSRPPFASPFDRIPTCAIMAGSTLFADRFQIEQRPVFQALLRI